VPHVQPVLRLSGGPQVLARFDVRPCTPNPKP
jgi:hypothetical protein